MVKALPIIIGVTTVAVATVGTIVGVKSIKSRKSNNNVEKLSNESLDLRSSSETIYSCGFCRYFRSPSTCQIIKGPVSKQQVCDAFQGGKSTPRYKIAADEFDAFAKGMVKLQPYQHKVIGGIMTPKGPLLLIEDTLKPTPRRFSLPSGFSIEHTSREHGWSQKDVDGIIKAGR